MCQNDMFNHLMPIIQDNSHPGWISSLCEMTDSSSFFAECPLGSARPFKGLRQCDTCAECEDTLDTIEFHSRPLFMLMIALFGGEILVSIGVGKVGPLL